MNRPIELYTHNENTYLSVLATLRDLGKTAVIHPTGVVNNIENLCGIGTVGQEMQAAVSYYRLCIAGWI